MNYYQFVNEVEEKVRKGVADKAKVQVRIAVKNNGKKRRGLMIVQEGVNISPTIYLEEYYEQFQNGNSLEQIAEEILKLYKEVRFKKSWEADDVQCYDKVKDMIVYKLVNREKNKELLTDIPHRCFQDLAVVCYVLLEFDKSGTATMVVKKEHLKMWGVTEREVFEQAEKNSVRLLPAEFSRMKDVIAEMLELDFEEESAEDLMYILSNKMRNFGAVCVLYEGVMEMIAEKLGENYYVIPSSVHEVIVIPESKAPEKCEIEEMVSEINETQVGEEDILSDKVYYYDRKEKRLA